jgi:hypothetical protein
MLVDIGIAVLDDPEAVVATLHLWTENRIGWFDNRGRLAASSDKRASLAVLNEEEISQPWL